jgi:quercetin dioxygenase-like cupin family protein
MGSRYNQMRAVLCLVVVIALSCMQIRSVSAADPDPLLDNPLNLTSFTLHDIFHNGDVSSGPGGVRAAVNTQNFPGTTSQGITVVRFEMVPCGVNVPHTHPRASELLSLISGGPLQVGFIDTSGNAHLDIINPGDSTLFPRGLLHFEINLGTENATYISALNSQNPGTLNAAASLFAVPELTLATALNTDFSVIKQIADSISPDLTSLALSSKANCVPGQVVQMM